MITSTFWDRSESIAATLTEAKAYMVRARYRLARCYELVDEQDVSRFWKQSADVASKEYMESRGRSVGHLVVLEDFYDNEVAWMLW